FFTILHLPGCVDDAIVTQKSMLLCLIQRGCSMHFDIFTLFPEMFSGPFSESILKRAQDQGRLSVALHNIRAATTDKHHIVDDYPYGGGAGMVMKPEPIFTAVESVYQGG